MRFSRNDCIGIMHMALVWRIYAYIFCMHRECVWIFILSVCRQTLLS